MSSTSPTNLGTPGSAAPGGAIPEAPPAAAARTALVVALDGPASSGKSSVGAAAARNLGLRFVDTGLLYRAVTALALRDGVATDDAPGLVALAGRVSLAEDAQGRLTHVLLDGSDATEEARGPEVDAVVSAVSRVPELREALLPRQRALAAGGGIVVAGRDIGTVVLPDAGLKLFLDASVDERAARRIEERGLDPVSPDAEDVREQLRARDLQDRSRAVAPLRAADDATVLHTDGNPFEATVALVTDEIRRAVAAAAIAWAPVAGPKPAKSPRPSARPDTVVENFDNDQTMLVKMTALVSRIGARLCANIRVDGLERIPRSGAVILAANHVSNADGVVVGAWVTPALHNRRIHWLGKRELFDWPIFGWLGRNGGIHPVDRGTADVEAFRLATRILEAGFVLMVFPEGTRSPDGRLQEAKDGLAMLALRTGATIVPIGVNDSDRVWPKGQKLPSILPRRTITARVGEPFRLDEVIPPGTERREAKRLATLAVMGRIAALLDERQRGVYAAQVPSETAPAER